MSSFSLTFSALAKALAIAAASFGLPAVRRDRDEVGRRIGARRDFPTMLDPATRGFISCPAICGHRRRGDQPGNLLDISGLSRSSRLAASS